MQTCRNLLELGQTLIGQRYGDGMHGHLLQGDYHRRWRNANDLLACSPLWKLPNARAHLLPEAGATQERALEAVRCSPMILIEAPSSAYHRGMLSLENNHSHEEETSCASTPNSTNFIVVSTCTLVPCTSVF